MLNKNKANKAVLISFMATYVRACLPFMHGSVIDNYALFSCFWPVS